MKNQANLSRRQFLATSAAALAGCSPQASDTNAPRNASDEKNLYTVLSKHTLRGQNGEKVNIDALRVANGNKYATLSFSFVGCGKQFCPLTNQSLAKLGQSDNLVHYVVNLAPDLEGGFTPNDPEGKKTSALAARNDFENYLRAVGVKGKVEVLWPENTLEAKQIQIDAGIVTVKNDDPRDHATQIALYKPGGEQQTGFKNGADIHEDLSDWVQLVQGAGPRR